MLPWILRLVASSGLLGLVTAWPATPQAAVLLALAVCAVGAALALAEALRTSAPTTPTAGPGLPGRALPLPR